VRRGGEGGEEEENFGVYRLPSLVIDLQGFRSRLAAVLFWLGVDLGRLRVRQVTTCLFRRWDQHAEEEEEDESETYLAYLAVRVRHDGKFPVWHLVTHFRTHVFVLDCDARGR
jgi:hypothetical protein